MYAELAVDNTSLNTDRLFTYSVPSDMEFYMEVGKRVLVPFGRGNKLLEGLVVNLKRELDSGLDPGKLKPIHYVVDRDPIMTREMVDLLEWMRERYLAKYTEVIKTIVPNGITMKAKKVVKVEMHIDETIVDPELADYLNSKKRMAFESLKRKFGEKNIQKDINRLCQMGCIEIEESVFQQVKKQYEKHVERRFKPEDADIITETLSKRAVKQVEIVRLLASRESISRKELLVAVNTSDSAIKSLEKKGLVETVEREVDRNPVGREIAHYSKIELNAAQRMVYDEIESFKHRKHLIHGVTGSGKTEVYLQLIESAMERGEESIVMVPEIALTPQTLDRFMGRFGDSVAIYHSKLSNGERYDEWRKMKEGRAKVAIGTRSAVFAPFRNLGLIIMDEEHEQSYKSSMNPKYSTIEVAEKRCELEGARLVLGSATPSVETYYRAESGEFKLLEMNLRANESPLPNINLIDMREELYNGNKSIFSRELYLSILEKLKRHEQIILFLNSRGFSKFVSCRSCGHVIKCSRCDISMTYHAEENRLVCHYCGESKKMVTGCPECGSKYVKHMGLGTQKVEAEVRKHFPKAVVERMDLDTTGRKHSHEEILCRMKNREIDILIGTQMISKGLDFPDVTLVGVIIADTSLNIPDYKAPERTFQLMTQVAGRAGRSELEGRVVIQTYEPDHYSIQTAKQHDYRSFYSQEIMVRKLFRYPPFCELVDITIYGREESSVCKIALEVAKRLEDFVSKSEDLRQVEVLGPNPALIYRIKDRYRMKILIKARPGDMSEIKTMLGSVLSQNERYAKEQVRVSIDINPNSII